VTPSDPEKDLIWKIYCELGQTERHFNTLQAQYRQMASTWLLAAFGGLGFVLSGKVDPRLSIPGDLLVTFLGLATAFGIGLLWMLDLRVYHRLLDAAFIEGKLLEEKHSWLPPYRKNIRAFLRGNLLPTVVWFYIAGIETGLLISGIALLSFLRRTGFVIHLQMPVLPSVLNLAMPTLYVAGLMALVAYTVHRSTGRTPEMEKFVMRRRFMSESRFMSDSMEAKGKNTHAMHIRSDISDVKSDSRNAGDAYCGGVSAAPAGE
jgi:hypothetical protein